MRNLLLTGLSALALTGCISTPAQFQSRAVVAEQSCKRDFPTMVQRVRCIDDADGGTLLLYRPGAISIFHSLRYLRIAAAERYDRGEITLDEFNKATAMQYQAFWREMGEYETQRAANQQAGAQILGQILQGALLAEAAHAQAKAAGDAAMVQTLQQHRVEHTTCTPNILGGVDCNTYH